MSIKTLDMLRATRAKATTDAHIRSIDKMIESEERSIARYAVRPTDTAAAPAPKLAHSPQHSTMTTTRNPPTCSHCLEDGHTKASPTCPLKGKDPVPRPGNPYLDKDWEPENISDAEDLILSIINERGSQCDVCKDILFCDLLVWRGSHECPSCYSLHREEIDALWKCVHPHTSCRCCGRSPDSGMPFHYDHLNMFEKKDSVCRMVRRGDSLEEILTEANKCQSLCKSCHPLITDLENRIGFRRIKISITRAINGTSASGEILSAERVEELQNHYREMYMRILVPLYPTISQCVRIISEKPRGVP